MNKLSSVAGLALLAISQTAPAASIGNWSGSSRSWNNFDFVDVKQLMSNNGHTVNADSDILGTLNTYDVFVMGEPGSTPNAAELGELSSWVSGGGILLLLADSGNSGLPGLDNIATGLGISFDWGGGVSGNRTLLGGNFASEGLYDLVGQTLITTPGTGVTGGTVLAQNYLDYASLGLGWVFGFGDRLDHNVFINPIGHNVNGDLFLNIANGPVGGSNSVPEPTTIWLLSLGLFAGLMFAPKKRAAVI